MAKIRIIIAFLLLFSSNLKAQSIRYGVIEDTVRNKLAKLWNADTSVIQSEKGYCVTSYEVIQFPSDNSINAVKDTMYRVFQIVDAKYVKDSSDENNISFSCPKGFPGVHTHTPTTCYAYKDGKIDPDFCFHGGPDAYECFPSRTDVISLIRRGDDFGIIQCGEYEFRFFYPWEINDGHIQIDKEKIK